MFTWLVVISLIVASVFQTLLTPVQSRVQEFYRNDAPSNILLLTAHPDDECMFFAPTLTALVKTSISHKVDIDDAPDVREVKVHSLCLSSGNADGLGEIRRQEFERSLDVLGVEKSNRWVLDQPDLQDDITSPWDEQIIARAIEPYIIENNITTILTFDREGISSHPNHKSLPFGVLDLLSHWPVSPPPPRLYTLITVPLIHKYIGPFSAALAKLDFVTAVLLERFGLLPSPSIADRPGVTVFVSGWQGYRVALDAMKQHQSQLVWFRWLYVAFSRYMWVNEWVELTPPTHSSSAP